MIYFERYNQSNDDMTVKKNNYENLNQIKNDFIVAVTNEKFTIPNTNPSENNYIKYIIINSRGVSIYIYGMYENLKKLFEQLQKILSENNREIFLEEVFRNILTNKVINNSDTQPYSTERIKKMSNRDLYIGLKQIVNKWDFGDKTIYKPAHTHHSIIVSNQAIEYLPFGQFTRDLSLIDKFKEFLIKRNKKEWNEKDYNECKKISSYNARSREYYIFYCSEFEITVVDITNVNFTDFRNKVLGNPSKKQILNEFACFESKFDTRSEAVKMAEEFSKKMGMLFINIYE